MANIDLVTLGSLLHDVDDHKLFNTTNNYNVRKFMMDNGLNNDIIEQVIDIINSVSFTKNRDRKITNINAMIVQDADRLDAIGAIGIARCFMFTGAHSGKIDDGISHFYEKLLKLKDLMNTKEGRKIAIKRQKIMENYLKLLNEEIEGSNIILYH